MYGYLAVCVSSVCVSVVASECVCGDRCFSWGENGSGLPNMVARCCIGKKMYVCGQRVRVRVNKMEGGGASASLDIVCCCEINTYRLSCGSHTRLDAESPGH